MTDLLADTGIYLSSGVVLLIVLVLVLILLFR